MQIAKKSKDELALELFKLKSKNKIFRNYE